MPQTSTLMSPCIKVMVEVLKMTRADEPPKASWDISVYRFSNSHHRGPDNITILIYKMYNIITY